MGAADGVRVAETQGPTGERVGRAARVLGGSPSSPRGCSGAARSAPSRDPRGRGGAAWPGSPGVHPPAAGPARVRPRRPAQSPHPSTGSGVAPRTRCCWQCQHHLSLSRTPGTELARVPASAAPRAAAPCPKSRCWEGVEGGLRHTDPAPTPVLAAHPGRPPFPRPHLQGSEARVLILGSPSGCRGCVREPLPSQIECSLALGVCQIPQRVLDPEMVKSSCLFLWENRRGLGAAVCVGIVISGPRACVS